MGNNGIIYAKNFGVIELYSQSGMVFYTENLIGCIIDGIVYGDTSLVGLNQTNSEVPLKYELFQNYPNPFNPETKINFSIPRTGIVKLTVFDMLGKEVLKLVNTELSPGTYSADWDASAYPSGVYYYKLEVIPSTGSLKGQTGSGFTETKKMVLIK